MVMGERVPALKDTQHLGCGGSIIQEQGGLYRCRLCNQEVDQSDLEKVEPDRRKNRQRGFRPKREYLGEELCQVKKLLSRMKI